MVRIWIPMKKKGLNGEVLLSDMEREEPPNHFGRLHALADIPMHLNSLNDQYRERIVLELKKKCYK